MEPAHRHLAASCVVNTEEQDGRTGVVALAFDLREGFEALAGETFREER
jgi:hypothetical protein